MPLLLVPAIYGAKVMAVRLWLTWPNGDVMPLRGTGVSRHSYASRQPGGMRQRNFVGTTFKPRHLPARRACSEYHKLGTRWLH